MSRSHLVGTYHSTGRPYSAYLAVFPAERFAFYPPVQAGCLDLVKPSISSHLRGCDYATNGAFFTWSNDTGSYCLGNLISDGEVWQLPKDGSGMNRANIGLTKGGAVVTGFIDFSTVAKLPFAQLITGWGWIVRNGASFVKSSQDLTFKPGGFALEKAPRTSLGVFLNGSLALLQVDGEEDIKAGPDLFELAELFVSVGIHSAVNLDGGGSSVSVFEGKVVNSPTCHDTPQICERAVASITCVKSK
uniref:Phosphodiester glycosidase domain-containing protein n=1 Tax=Arcella intermedia TaxID=1963864 RepID=A0A6B2LEU8_9EUKA